jgi:fatty acid desaturase
MRQNPCRDEYRHARRIDHVRAFILAAKDDRPRTSAKLQCYRGQANVAHAMELLAKRRRVDFRTLGVAIAIHSGYLSWSLSFTELPLWLAAPLGTLLLAWYGSLQHETIHGHPTCSRRVNGFIATLPLSLWVPYAIYREIHLLHHRHAGRRLTQVGHDPESFYLPVGHLSRVGRVRRIILRANCTLAGRLLLGPALAVATFWGSEARAVRSDPRRLLVWCRHVLGVGCVLAWTVGVCHVPLLVYVLLVVYPSVSLTHLRSFAEHRADDHKELRTNVVEAGPIWALLFLNNNLHIAHHLRPHLPWYELPRAWREMRHAVHGAGVVFSGGYREVFRKYLFRPFITVEHPSVSEHAQ